MLAPDVLSTICNDGDGFNLLSCLWKLDSSPMTLMFRAIYLNLIFGLSTGALVAFTTCLPCPAIEANAKKEWKKFIQQGNLSEIHKDYATASRAYSKALPLAESIGKRSPELIESLARIASLNLLVGNDREAEWNYRRLMESEWTDSNQVQGMQAAGAALDDLAETYEKIGKQPARIDFLMHALAIRERMAKNHPAIVENCLHISKYYHDKGNPKTAISFQRRAVAQAENTPNYSPKKYCGQVIRLSVMYQDNQMFKECIDTLEELRVKAKKQPALLEGQEVVVFRMIGRGYFGLNDFEKSEANFKQALQYDKDSLITNIRLAETYLRWGKKGKTEECLARAELIAKKTDRAKRRIDIERLRVKLRELR